jgi:hypothetical protein
VAASRPATTRADGGPLGPAGNQTTLCLPVQRGHAVSDGYQFFTNISRGTLTVERLFLAKARNIKITGAFLVPIDGNDLIGTLAGFPPRASQLPSGVEWGKRHLPAGARVLPGEQVNYVVGLASASRVTTGSTAGIVLWYRDARGTQYELQSNVQVIIKVSPARCR